jgi:hypothetical protein
VPIKSLLLTSALIATSVFAQESLGTVGNVQGLVTDTDGATVSSTVQGEVIRDGERFVTSSSGSVTLTLNNGCTLTLQPNQAVTVLKSMTCQELVSAVRPVGGASFAGGGSFGTGLMSVGGLAIAGFAMHRGLDKNPSISGH